MRLLVLLSALCLSTMCSTQSFAAGCSDWFKSNFPLSEDPQASDMAIVEPDCYAWRLFIAMNWPADVTKKEADQSRTLGSHGPVVWETWRSARNGAPDTAFPVDGSDPGPWLDAPVVATMSNRFEESEPPLQQVMRAVVIKVHGGPTVLFDPATAGRSVNETRLNRDTYEFIRAHKLYNLNGQIALFQNGAETISFPLKSKEVKAQWREITEVDKPRYHWTESTTPQGFKIFGLTALHITRKDLPNWFWATFEHMDNKKADAKAKPPAEGWLLPSVDRFACPTAPHDCEAIPSGIGLEGTQWENYRLRGTQIDFIDSRGRPLRLANSQPEASFQTTSSCITCHALASVNDSSTDDGRRLQFVDDDGQGFVGIPTGFLMPREIASSRNSISSGRCSGHASKILGVQHASGDHTHLCDRFILI